MPLVSISLLKGESLSYIKSVADGVNSAVIEMMGFHRDDRYQTISEHEPHCLEYQTHTGNRMMMHLIMRAGHADEEKKAFYRKVVENLARDLGIDAGNIIINIAENQDIDWSFRDGNAQLVT